MISPAVFVAGIGTPIRYRKRHRSSQPTVFRRVDVGAGTAALDSFAGQTERGDSLSTFTRTAGRRPPASVTFVSRPPAVPRSSCHAGFPTMSSTRHRYRV